MLAAQDEGGNPFGPTYHLAYGNTDKYTPQTAKALFRAAHARVAKHLEGSSGGATTPTADASTPAEEEQPTTKSSSYSITASLGLTLLVDVEAIIRAHLESVVCVAKGLNGLTLQVVPLFN